MDWKAIYDVWDVISTSLSLPIGVGGLWFAIVQIRKTLSAAQAAQSAARDAANYARLDARRTTVLILVPQLQRIEEQIDRAIALESTELLTSWATTWRYQAGQLNQYLRKEELGSTELPSRIQASVLAAATVKQGLGKGSQAQWARTTKRLTEAVAAVTNDLGGIVVEYTELPEDGNN